MTVAILCVFTQATHTDKAQTTDLSLGWMPMTIPEHKRLIKHEHKENVDSQVLDLKKAGMKNNIGEV